MTQAGEALEALSARPQLVSARRWPGGLTGIDQPGLYAWWADASGAQDLSRGLGLSVAAGLVYVGQAGAPSSAHGIPSAATLRSRIGKDHLGGKVRSSTLRCTLAGILAGPLGLRIAGERKLDEASEERLSEWMDARLSLAVWPAPPAARLAELEKQVVQALEPPLNRGHLPPTELRRRLRERRAIITHGIDDLWSAPDPALTDWRRVLGEYGQAFDGYRYAKLVRRCECSEVADEVWRHHDEQRLFTSSFADLRCALFWLQRLVHSAEQSPGWRPDADLERRVQLLYKELLDDWARVTSAASPAEPADSVISVSTQAELHAAAASFDRDWGGVDEVLYRLCREHPAHDDRRQLTAKIVLVGRAYSAGLERCVQVPPGGQAVMIVADHLADQGAEVDALLAPLRALREPLTGSDFAAIVAAHGRLLALLAGACAPGKTPRSFAAKYLHFHAPVVPIYDEYARITLTRLVHWSGNALPFARPQGADPEYYDFCVRFWRLYEACRKKGVAASVKALDQYLWAVPTAGT